MFYIADSCNDTTRVSCSEINAEKIAILKCMNAH